MILFRLICTLILFSEILAMEDGYYQPFDLKAQAMAYVLKHAVELSKLTTQKIALRSATTVVNAAAQSIPTQTNIEELRKVDKNIKDELREFLELWQQLQKYSAISDAALKQAHKNIFTQQVLIALARKEPFENDLHRQLRLLPHPPCSQEAMELVRLAKSITSSEQLESTELEQAKKDAIKALWNIQNFGNILFSPTIRSSLLIVSKESSHVEAALLLQNDKFSQYQLETELLIGSILYNKPKTLDFLLSRNISPNAHKGYNQLHHNTLLTGAAYTIHPEVVQVLLGHGANINQPDAFGNTPLMAAIESDKEDSIKLLLHHGANVSSLKNKQGETGYSLLLKHIREKRISISEETVQLFEDRKKQENLLTAETTA